MRPGTRFDADATAAALLDARAMRRPMPKLPDALRPADVAEGAAAQLAIARARGVARPGGFKIGATSQTMQDYLGLRGPASGYMAADDLHASGVTLDFAGFLRPGVECELAVRLAHDLPPGPCTPAQAAAAIGTAFAAMEVVENRYAHLAEFGTPAMIADQVFHAAAVLGDPVPFDAATELAARRGELRIDGTRRGGGIGADLLGDPLRALAWLAGSEVAAAFGGLRAGQVVLLGSVTPPIWLDGPCHATVAFTGLSDVRAQFR
jgi:2-keto-4-pentenoate hydratase